MLNTRNEEHNKGFYSYLACFVNTFTLNMYVSMSYTVLGLTLYICIYVKSGRRIGCSPLASLLRSSLARRRQGRRAAGTMAPPPAHRPVQDTGGGVGVWPLHNIAMTNVVWCMAC